jgi:hypothetical protein
MPPRRARLAAYVVTTRLRGTGLRIRGDVLGALGDSGKPTDECRLRLAAMAPNPGRPTWFATRSKRWRPTVLLHEIAHCRAGDKGDTSTLSLFPYRDEDFPVLVREVTAARVREHLADHIRGEVMRYELLNLCALRFISRQALDGSVTTSLALDTHGKALSSSFLSLPL